MCIQDRSTAKIKTRTLDTKLDNTSIVTWIQQPVNATILQDEDEQQHGRYYITIT
jgi:hypothetical protein